MHGLSIVLTLRSIRGLRVSRAFISAASLQMACCWESIEVGQRINLGKRVDVSSTPMAIQITFHRIECVYQHACQVDTLEAWGKFQRV